MDGYEWIQLPRIMGHEYAGEVVTVAETVTQFEPGDKVVEEPVHSCGECFQCQSGQPNVCQDFSITGCTETVRTWNTERYTHDICIGFPKTSPASRGDHRTDERCRTSSSRAIDGNAGGHRPRGGSRSDRNPRRRNR